MRANPKGSGSATVATQPPLMTIMPIDISEGHANKYMQELFQNFDMPSYIVYWLSLHDDLLLTQVPVSKSRPNYNASLACKDWPWQVNQSMYLMFLGPTGAQ